MISLNLLNPVLSRWELNPPAIFGGEAHGDLQNVFGALRSRSIVRQTAGVASVDCTECGEFCEVNYLPNAVGEMQGFICCSYCGVSRVPPQAMERWEIDTSGFLQSALSGVNLALQERVTGNLWQVGKANWAGRSREVWFARAFQRGHVSDALKMLEGRPKAILFVPTETGAERWRDATKNLVIALEQVLLIVDGAIHFDADYVEGRIIDAGMGPNTVPKRRAKQRGDRAAKIELLKNEMIQHLRAARDHAFATKDQTGDSQLLPRPTQKAIGERVDLSEWDVTRCLKDENAAELRLYWEFALDLHQIMAWKGPVKLGRKE